MATGLQLSSSALSLGLDATGKQAPTICQRSASDSKVTPTGKYQFKEKVSAKDQGRESLSRFRRLNLNQDWLLDVALPSREGLERRQLLASDQRAGTMATGRQIPLSTLSKREPLVHDVTGKQVPKNGQRSFSKSEIRLPGKCKFKVDIALPSFEGLERQQLFASDRRGTRRDARKGQGSWSDVLYASISKQDLDDGIQKSLSNEVEEAAQKPNSKEKASAKDQGRESLFDFRTSHLNPASEDGLYSETSTLVSGHVTRSLHHYKVPISCWQDLFQSQKSIKYMLDFCDGVEKKAGYSKHRQEADIGEVDIYIDTDFYEIESVVPDVTISCKRELHTWNVSEETDDKNIVSNFKGVLVDSGGPKFVKSLQGSNITVIKEDGSWCIENTCDDTFQKTVSMKTKHLIERVIFEPLIERCEFLRQVLNARTKGSAKCFDENILDQFNQQRDIVEDLFEEMVAAISRSHLNGENVIKLKRYLESRSVSREVSEELFKKERTVKGCGYRLKTLHVDVERLPTKEENDDREQRIRDFLSNHDITDIKFNFVSPTLEEYSKVGAHIDLKSDTTFKTGTLGCFANHSKDQKSSLCALLSKHVAQDCSSKIFLKGKDEYFGEILSDTYIDGGHDIVAAKVESKYISKCKTGFRNIENEMVPGELYRVGHTTNLQGHPIHLWGSKSKPGIGKVTRQHYHVADDTYIEVQDGSVALGKPNAVLAERGDSGAIVCMDESGGEKVIVISMLMGSTSETVLPDERVKRKYLTLPLSSGLQTLEKRTNGTFQLQGTDTSVKSAGKMLDPTNLFTEKKDEDKREEEPRNQKLSTDTVTIV